MFNTPIGIVFAGTPTFAVPALRALIADPAFHVKLVISQPDKPVGRKQEILPTPVKAAALEAGIEVLQPRDINKEYPEIDHDFLVAVAYGQILKQHILDAPNIAPINVHASLLPRWRGASPMQSSILHGDNKTGVTLQRMVKELDAGPVLAQKVFPLHGTETIAMLHDSLADIGATLLVETLKHPLSETEQSVADITVCHKLTKDMGHVDPKNMTAEEIDRRVRALVPWPGVRCSVYGEEVKLVETSLTETKNSIELPCKDSVLYIATLQPPSKKPMSGKAWKHGRQ